MKSIKIKEWHIIAALFLFSFIIRFMYINTGLFHHDVVQQAKIIESGEVFGVGLPYLRIGLLLINLVMYKIYVLLTGNFSAEFVMNFSSVLFGALAIPAMYLFTKELTNKRFIAITASLFLSVTPVFLSISTYGKEHAMQVFFCLAALYTLLVAIRKDSIKLHIIASVLFGYFLLVREDSLIFIPLYLLLYFHPVYNKEARFKLRIAKDSLQLKRLLAAFLPLIAIFLPQIIYNTIPRIGIILSGTDSGAGQFLGIYSYMVPITMPIVARTTTYLLLFFMVVGIYCLAKRKEHFILAILLIWSSVLIYFMNNPIFSPRWLSITLPPMFILGAYGLDLLYDKKNMAMKYITIAFVVYVAITMLVTIQPIIKARHEHPLTKELLLDWKRDSPDGSVLLFPPDFCTHVGYYTGRKCSGNDNFSNTINIIDSNLKKGIYTYVAVNVPEANITQEEVKDFAIDLVKKYNVTMMITHEFEDYHKATINRRAYQFRILEINPNNVPKEAMS